MDLTDYKKITLPELQEIFIVRLKEVIEFFEKNNIEYFAIYGTTLGAFRHKGFIPWDNDIDLGMTRDNYERFLKIAKQLENGHFQILNHHFSKYVEHSLTKIAIKGLLCPECYLKKNFDHGYHIDIFPYDSVSDNSEKTKKLAKKTNRIKKLLYFKTKNKSSTWYKSIILFLYQLILLPWSTRRLAKKMDSLAQTYNQSEPNSKYVVDVIGARSYDRGTILRDCIKSTTIMDFSYLQIKVPVLCDVFLEKIYGPNYMTPANIRLDKDAYFAYAKKDFVL